MRVISGKYRRIPLETIPGDKTRPTTDRIKETLFNMIADDIRDCVFLDLFAGSGQIGIEALSRGAEHVTFVENNKRAFDCIRKNLNKVKADSENYNLYFSDAFKWLEKPGSYDLIFMDPPYSMNDQQQLVELISANDLLTDDGMAIVEATINNDDITDTDELEIFKVKKYKTNKHIFLRKRL